MADEYQCEEEGCDFSTDNAGAYANHTKSHEEDSVAESDSKNQPKSKTETVVVGEEKERKAKTAAEGQASGAPVTRTDVVDVDDDGNETVEQVQEVNEDSDDGVRTVEALNPNYGVPREDGLVGVDPDYPQQASRSGEDESDDS